MLIKVLSAVITVLAGCLIYSVLKQTSVEISNVMIDQTIRAATDNRLSSSVWCYYDKTLNKLCTFQNLFYLPDNKEFIFLLTNESIISGLRSKDDLKIINLSSVENHNNVLMKLQIVIHSVKHNLGNFVFVKEPVLLIKRFKSDNIMHVIHDDILPIFVTYSHLCGEDIEKCVYNNRLLFIDESDDNSYLDWYKIFSRKKPYNLNSMKTISCFNKINVGISRETIWFQYGFGIPHGPVASATINSLIINKFTNFILNYFNVKKPSLSFIDEEFINVVLFSRTNNRKILNENFVIDKISEIFRIVYPEYNKILKIHNLDPSQNKSSDIINVVTKSQVLVGMHGSAMIYSLFLPQNAAIVELFPFGIQPQFVSSTRALCLLPGIFYHYLSWRNFKETNSISYPERPALLGGIRHLSDFEQESIKNLKTIPAVECCHDPAYLYRMFQDTILDNSFEIILKQALINQKETLEGESKKYVYEFLKSSWFFPGPVSNLTCGIDKDLRKVLIVWNEPYNVNSKNVLLFNESILYHVTIKIFSRVVSLETFVSSVSVKITLEEVNSLRLESNIQVWTKAVVDENEGSDVHSYCASINQL